MCASKSITFWRSSRSNPVITEITRISTVTPSITPSTEINVMIERKVRFGFKYRSARKTLKGSFKSAIPWLRTQDLANDENITGSHQAQMITNETQMGSGGEPNRLGFQVQRERNIRPDTDHMEPMAFSIYRPIITSKSGHSWRTAREDMTSIFIERTSMAFSIYRPIITSKSGHSWR